MRSFSGESYRFCCHPSFEAPITVRVTRNENGCVIVAYGTADRSLYGKTVDKRRRLTGGQWLEIERRVAAMRFWSAPPKSNVGIDGSTWTLEGAAGDRSQCWKLWCPSSSGRQGQFRNLCQYLFELSKLGADGVVL